MLVAGSYRMGNGQSVSAFLSLVTWALVSQKTNDSEMAHLQKQEALSALAAACGPNDAQTPPELLAGLPAVGVAAAWAFFAVSCEERSRGAAWRGARGSHPIPTAILAMSGRAFQIAWPLAPL